MSENMMRYKGYTARIEYSPEDRCFVGRVLGIRDVVSFHGASVVELEKDFRETMEFYFETCRLEGKELERPYSGKLMLRLPVALHRRVAQASEATGKSINDIILDALRASDIAAPAVAVNDVAAKAGGGKSRQKLSARKTGRVGDKRAKVTTER